MRERCQNVERGAWQRKEYEDCPAILRTLRWLCRFGAIFKPEVIIGIVALWATPGLAESTASVFDQANKLYEQGKYTEAAMAYEKLVGAASASPALYFNLGNAWFKAGQSGRAIAAYRQAEKLAPRDPNLRFNLNFVRKKVSGSDSVPPENWRRWLATLTLNEWTTLAMIAFWLWFLLLALRELRPSLRKNLGGYTATAGAAAIALVSCLATTAYEQSHLKQAVWIS